MAHKKLTAAQKQRKQEWISHRVDQTFKAEAKETTFDSLLNRLGIAECEAHNNAEVREWCSKNKNSKYISENVLHRMHVGTAYDAEPSAFSIVAGVVVPETLPLQEVRDETIAQEAA